MYCTVDDLAKQVGTQALLERADDEGTGNLNAPAVQARIAQAIADASATIDAYAQARYPVPFDPVPRIITKICVDLALYNLFARRGIVDDDSADRAVVDRHRAAMSFLRDLADGRIQLGASTPRPSGDARFQGPQRIFSRERLEGF